MPTTDYTSGGGSLFGDVFATNSNALAGTATSQTWLGDAWNSTTGFLQDGLNIYKDYLTVTGQNQPYMIPAGMSYDQYSEQYQPTPTMTPGTIRQPASGGQWVPGVDNAVLMLSGAAIGLLFLSLK